MSVVPSDIVTYGSANMPEADGVTIGGAVDFTKRVAFYDISASRYDRRGFELGLGYGDQDADAGARPDRRDPDA